MTDIANDKVVSVSPLASHYWYIPLLETVISSMDKSHATFKPRSSDTVTSLWPMYLPELTIVYKLAKISPWNTCACVCVAGWGWGGGGRGGGEEGGGGGGVISPLLHTHNVADHILFYTLTFFTWYILEIHNSSWNLSRSMVLHCVASLFSQSVLTDVRCFQPFVVTNTWLINMLCVCMCI